MNGTNRCRHPGASASASLLSAVADTFNASEASFGPHDSAKGRSVAKIAKVYAKFTQFIALKSTIRFEQEV